MSDGAKSKLDERLKKSINRARTIWWLQMMGATIITTLYMPWWCLFLLIPFAFISYMAVLYVTILLLAATVPPEEIQQAARENEEDKLAKEKLDVVTKMAERIRSGEEPPKDEVIKALSDAGIVDVVKVHEVGPAIGTYKDKEIFEYILVKAPKDAEPSKLVYHGPANVVNGLPEIPVIDGMIFANVNGILYSKEVGPA